MTEAVIGAVNRNRAMVAVALLVCVWLTVMQPDPEVPATAHAAAPTTPAKRPQAGATSPSPKPKTGLVPVVAPPRRNIDCTVVKCIALTFDDGPMPGTAKLLNTLAAHKARATFFVVGVNVAAYPDLVRRAVAEGHEIGNHSWSHADLGRSSKGKVRSEIGRTQDAVRRAIGRPPDLFRPPYGSTDGQVAAIARQNGLPQIIWSVDTFDWRDRNSRVVERRAVREAHRGAIILMHDIHRTSVSAVPHILEALARKGYVFVTVSELYSGQTLSPGTKYRHRCPPPPPPPPAVPAAPTVTPSVAPSPGTPSVTPPGAAGTPSAPAGVLAAPSAAPPSAPPSSPPVEQPPADAEECEG
ncbi:polysaccharide deacetylase family protein [Actinomadura craniellae]|uniref:polysaccharide deacetylase family protein n=1 Tax=Actinomadura craniellae TaxID=2231787 RepID=UPI001F48D8F8|nr:polysaccharide deacetylase family protein [Actinomadura craniellae]